MFIERKEIVFKDIRKEKDLRNKLEMVYVILNYFRNIIFRMIILFYIKYI